MSGPLPAADRPPVAIICGGGRLPFAVADAAQKMGRGVLVYALRGWADPQSVGRYVHEWGSIGEIGRFVEIARKHGCRDVVFIGSLTRPDLRKIRLDWTTFRFLPRIARLFYGGDNHLISGMGQILEELGFHMRGAHEIAPDILVPEGSLGACKPTPEQQADIARGLDVIRAMGPFDIGQAVVVANNHVLAIEAAEGTDQMLERVADLRRVKRIRLPQGTGVLVKAPKPEQDRRFDLPSIGPQTIDAAARAGLAGIAVLASETIMAEPETLAREADRRGLFVVGVPGRG